MDLEPGQVFGGKYRILRLLGQGGMGAVYEGENVRIHRRVAIKTLHAGIAAKADTVARFEREAQAAGRIGSEHIVEVLDMGELEDGSRFMVMEFCEGMTFADRIKSRGRLTPQEACPIVMQLLEGLGAAHAAGIIHRDLKPANIFLLHSRQGRADFVKILDFGVSKFSVLDASDEMSMTRTGAVVGTPYYMSPEQAKGSREIDARSDLYAVGVILYECITGQVPFSAETFNELLFRIVLESPPPAESYVPDLDPAFAAILRRSMSRETGERFQTAQEFAETLGGYLARAAGLMAFGNDDESTNQLRPTAALAAVQAQARAAARGLPTQPLPAMPMAGQQLAAGGTMMMDSARPPGMPPQGMTPQQQSMMQQQQGMMQQGMPPQGMAPQQAPPQGWGPPPASMSEPPPASSELFDLQRPPPARGGLVVGIAALAIVVIGGGGVALLRWRDAAPVPPVASTSAAAPPVAPASASSAASTAAAADSARPPIDLESPPPGAIEPTVADAPARPSGGAVASKPAPASAPRTPRPAPTTAPAPTAAPKPTTTVDPKAKPPGRKISTEL